MFTIEGEEKKDDDLQNGLIKQSFFETIFNMTLDIDGKIMGSHRVMPQYNLKKKLNFTISNRWDGRTVQNTGGENVKLSLEQGTNETVVVNILAPFFEVRIGDIGALLVLFSLRIQNLLVELLACPTSTSGTMRLLSFSFLTTRSSILKCRSELKALVLSPTFTNVVPCEENPSGGPVGLQLEHFCQVGPHGHYLLILLNGRRNVARF